MPTECCVGLIGLPGFGELVTERGEDEATAALTELWELAGAEADAIGVERARSLAGSIMLRAPDPTAIIACSAIVMDRFAHETNLPSRGGLAQGLVVEVATGHYAGAALDDVALLYRAARPNQLLATPAVALQAPTWLDIEPVDGPRLALSTGSQILRVVVTRGQGGGDPPRYWPFSGPLDAWIDNSVNADPSVYRSGGTSPVRRHPQQPGKAGRPLAGGPLPRAL